MAHKKRYGERRVAGICSCCGESLPENKKGWGLNWYDGAGMCAKCLYTIRKAIGYFERLERERQRELDSQ